MILTQLGIAATGVVAIYLAQSLNLRQRKWSSVFGLLGQPFWFYEAITAEQWGIVFLCGLYTVSWGKGFYNYWIKKPVVNVHCPDSFVPLGSKAPLDIEGKPLDGIWTDQGFYTGKNR